VTELGQLPPAGWYVDPGDPAQARYWDGGAWSRHVTTLPAAVAPQAAPTTAHVGPARSTRTFWVMTAVIVAGLLVGGSLALLTRHGSGPSANASPKEVAAAYYRPVFQRLIADIAAVNDATTDSDFVAGCGQLHADLPAARGLPHVTDAFDRTWAEFTNDATTFATLCLGGPASASGGTAGAYDRLNADATDVATAFENLPG
jgi:hypothetical protein